VQQDPVVSQVKLIAEPWDVGEGGYQVGNFPPLWSEWNGQYRDIVRDFWRGKSGTLGDFASRLSGSSDLYEASGRRPVASINFVTCHDGFTLNDLVSYNHKHNEANGEGNRDGTDDNRSWNCGAEGPTSDRAVSALRARQQRNFLTTLLLSQGIPMLLAGDEFGRTQRGNNNAYCQDNEISWLDWRDRDTALAEFAANLVRLRTSHPVFRRRRFFRGQDIRGGRHQLGDIAWFTPAGEEMTDDDWDAGFAKGVVVFLNGDAISEPDQRGERVRDEAFLLLFNASEQDMDFTIPPAPYGENWLRELDTAVAAPAAGTAARPAPPRRGQPERPEGAAAGGEPDAVKAGDRVPVPSRSMQVLRRA